MNKRSFFGKSARCRNSLPVSAVGLVLLTYGLGAACARTEFNSNDKSKTQSPTSSAPVTSAAADVVIENSEPTADDLLVPCGANGNRVDKEGGGRAQRIFVPVTCLQPRTEKPDPNRGMDVAVVLDVTGTMKPQIEAIRSNFLDLISELKLQGWNPRLGAVGFTDKIEDVIAVTSEVQSVLDATAPTKPAWNAESGKGGADPVESGMVAIECGLTILSGANNCNSVNSTGKYALDNRDKTLIYVSDAPARNSKSNFEVSGTARNMRSFADEAIKNSATFRVFYSSTSERKNLPDEIPGYEFNIPTPIVQLTNLVETSGVLGVKLKYPISPAGFKAAVTDKLKEGKIVQDKCLLTSVEILNADGTPSVPKVKISNTGTGQWVHPLQKLSGGIYSVLLNRTCATGGAQTSKVSVEL